MRAEDRRRQLLDVSLECFARGGYHGTSTAQLAEAAGITPPVLYRHFAGKQDLFIELINEAGEHLRVRWLRGLRNAADPAARVEALLAGPHRDAAAGVGILLAGLSEAPRNRPIRSCCQRQLRALRQSLSAEIESLQKTGHLRRALEAPQIASLVVSSWVGGTATGADRELSNALATLLGQSRGGSTTGTRPLG